VHHHHTIDYIEFTVRDLAAAKRFYANAFGWRFEDHGPDYAGIKGPEGEVGGLHRTTELRTGGPLVVLYSNDLDQSVVAVRSAGGRWYPDNGSDYYGVGLVQWIPGGDDTNDRGFIEVYANDEHCALCGT
jgi:uncharacterized protein